MTSDEEHLRAAIARAARSAAEGGGPFGARIVRDGLILAEANNAVVLNHDPTAHAEVRAIRQACAKLETHDLTGAVLYSSCEPCPMCLGAIHWARIDRLVYAADRRDAADAGFDDALLYEEVSLPVAERRLPTIRALATEGTEPFRVWADNQGRTQY